nr:hypothetical protein [Tanacetum cinerariifolium]
MTVVQTSGSGNTFPLAVAFFFGQWEVPYDSDESSWIGVSGVSFIALQVGTVKEKPEKDKIGSKPDKNGKRVEARKSLKQLNGGGGGDSRGGGGGEWWRVTQWIGGRGGGRRPAGVKMGRKSRSEVRVDDEIKRIVAPGDLYSCLLSRIDNISHLCDWQRINSEGDLMFEVFNHLGLLCLMFIPFLCLGLQCGSVEQFL